MQSIEIDNQQIPLPATSFVGRAEDVVRLSDLLVRPDVRLVTMIGPGGVGKTRLALQIAHEIDRDVVGDIHLVLLANTTDADAVPAAIARAVNATPIGSLPVERRIIDTIADRRALLILDNAEQIAEDLAILPTLIGACPNLTILVTSRVMLRLSAEHVFQVEPLPTASTDEQLWAPATSLFVERAQAVRPDLALTPGNIRAIDDICRQVDGLPLAIELAAARTRFLSPVILKERLSARLHLLIGGPRDAPERHRTLRATLTWSHDLLSTGERLLFRRLAVFENGGPYDAVGPVCNATGDLGSDVEEILSSLVDHSLVRIIDRPATGPRVRLLHTIREFAHEQLTSSGERDALRSAHARWFADLVNTTPEETWRTGTAELRGWTLRHLPDLDNFSLALETLMVQQDHAAAIGMVAELSQFWVELGNFRAGREWSRRLMPYAGEASIEAQARMYRMAGALALDNDVTDEALTYTRRALTLSEQLGNARLIANCQNLLGVLYWRMGQPDEGERLQRAAIETIRSTPAHLGGEMIAAQLAGQLLTAGEPDRAEPLLRQALPVIETFRPDALPLFQGLMAHLALLRNNLDEAGFYLERSLQYHREPPHRLPLDLSGRLMHISDLAARRNAPEYAARLYSAAEVICDRLGYTMADNEKIDEQRIKTLIRDAIGDEQLAVEFAAGRAMSIPESIEMALGVSRMRSETQTPGTPSESAHDDILTPRERDVLTLLTEGRSNAAIAEELFISQRTVTTHLSRLYAKLDVSTRTEAIFAARRMGLVDQT